ncbi:cell division protein ZapA [Litorimonas taeanensis]|uniref:Cell division protein ZapA n=1 Tax=Litorimonas taeanensis TaxID=568099 RepID=A0A420WKU8_9PROT|nr:cell division protein ZapA [Litorimonas taeanensis]RKQ71599.1 cell division protein ZapA [Litorimonas taeanensis]
MMGRVSLNINGRKYGLGCEPGEEERLMRLGQKLDDRVNAMANQFGQIGDLRLLVMAGITLLDELEDISDAVEQKVDERIGDVRKESEKVLAHAGEAEAKAAEGLLKAAAQIEKIAAKIESIVD